VVRYVVPCRISVVLCVEAPSLSVSAWLLVLKGNYWHDLHSRPLCARTCAHAHIIIISMKSYRVVAFALVYGTCGSQTLTQRLNQDWCLWIYTFRGSSLEKLTSYSFCLAVDLGFLSMLMWILRITIVFM
jgi:hypothetical protein